MPYRVKRASRSIFVQARGLRHHLHSWGDASLVHAGRPALVMLHGWMDVAASFQFIVDACAEERYLLALDCRGFGLTEWPATDNYWFPDYLADLDAVLDTLFPEQPVDLLGHSMGGNISMIYAGVRPARVRRLVNLEGFGMPDVPASAAPKRYGTWLDQLKTPMLLRPYDSLEAVAERLMKNDPLLPPERAAWLAPHWARRNEAGLWEILGDPAHKRINAVPYRADEVLACWKQIEAPVLWIEGDRTTVGKSWGTRYSRTEFDARFAVVRDVEKHVLSPAGHMVHHDQPEALASILETFVDRH